MADNDNTDLTVTRRPGSTWSQADLGEDFDVLTLAVIGGTDPTGEAHLVENVLRSFLALLETTLTTIENHWGKRSASGILAEAEKMNAAAGEVGAMRLCEACRTAINSFHIGTRTGAVFANATLDVVVDDLITEAIRTQRKIRRLLYT